MTTPKVDQKAVLVAKILPTGGVYTADTTVKQPTNATAPLDEAYDALGFIGTEGITRTIGRTTKNVMAASGVMVKTHTTEQLMTYHLTIMESNRAGLSAVFGPENVTITDDGGLRVAYNIKEMPRKSFVFELSEGVNSLREVIPDGQVTQVADTVMGADSEIAYKITITTFDDAAGNKAYSYISFGDGAAAVAPIITAATPSAAVAGDLVTLTGSGFTGATAVTFEGVAATLFTVDSATQIRAVMPDGVAGPGDIVVVNPIGSSTAFIYNRG